MLHDLPSDIEYRLKVLNAEIDELDSRRGRGDEDADAEYFDAMDEYGELQMRLYELRGGNG